LEVSRLKDFAPPPRTERCWVFDWGMVTQLGISMEIKAGLGGRFQLGQLVQDVEYGIHVFSLCLHNLRNMGFETVILRGL